MSNLNTERNQRLNQILNQIRERADLPSRWTPTWADVNFLLSLLDSQDAVETVMSSRTYASDQIIKELQSLTLEQGEQEKSK